MKKIVILLSLIVTGCANNAGMPDPLYYNGNFYLVDRDKNCNLFRRHDSGSLIQCYTANKEDRGPRRPMTQREIADYKQMQQQAQMQQQIAAQQVYTPQPMPVIQYPQMQLPQVTPLTRPGGNQVRCIGVGIYANCRSY